MSVAVRLLRSARSGKGARLTHADVTALLLLAEGAIADAAMTTTTECTCDLWKTYKSNCPYCESVNDTYESA